MCRFSVLQQILTWPGIHTKIPFGGETRVSLETNGTSIKVRLRAGNTTPSIPVASLSGGAQAAMGRVWFRCTLIPPSGESIQSDF